MRVVERGGVRGVIKRPRGNSPRTVARFKQEAAGLLTLTHQPGVLPIIDSGSDQRGPWFVTPQAVLLADHLGGEPNLRDVVECVADLADTLASLRKVGVAHRDIKPDNLFWFSERAVFGDFGIASWPSQPQRLTSIGDKMGSAHFLAPEVRAVRDGIDYFAADVWGLVKAMHVLANPADGPYPPGGTHYHGVAEFSLHAAGDRAARDLEWLLEASTDVNPADRPTAEVLAEELRVWLRKYPPGTVARRKLSSGMIRHFGDAAVQAEWRRFQQLTDIVDLQVIRAAIAIREPVDDTGCDMPSVSEDYPYSDPFDHFTSRASGTGADGLRAAVGALMWSSGTQFRIEIQQVHPDGRMEVLDVMRGDDVHPERPSGQALLDSLVEWATDRLHATSG